MDPHTCCLRAEGVARPYETGKAGMFELARPIFRHNPRVDKKRDKSKEMLDNLFCSELITEAYQAAGLLPEETLNSNEILPCMFGPDTKVVDRYLEREEHGYRLGPIQIYKAPDKPLHDAIMKRMEKLQAEILKHVAGKKNDLMKR